MHMLEYLLCAHVQRHDSHGEHEGGLVTAPLSAAAQLFGGDEVVIPILALAGPPAPLRTLTNFW